jgi:hypothetical protein
MVVGSGGGDGCCRGWTKLDPDGGLVAVRVGDRDGGYDLDRYTVKGELRKGPKRDRKAERERAEESW